jgi:hypothetical protein
MLKKRRVLCIRPFFFSASFTEVAKYTINPMRKRKTGHPIAKASLINPSTLIPPSKNCPQLYLPLGAVFI